MLNFPNAKINLGLQITEKRSDGYHNIDSCFYPVPLKDVLEITESTEHKLDSHGLDIPGDSKDNLIWKAYELLDKDHKLPPFEINLYKNIPMGAGMGGGSADGAFMLKLLNDKYQLGLSVENLEHYALELGSDCPFFIKNEACYVKGRGELLSPIKIDLSGYYLALILPGIHIGTKEAYAHITPNDKRQSVKEIIENEKVENWKDLLVNDFEASVFKLHPSLKELKDSLYASGAIYASMTGSGSTLFGLFKEKRKLGFVDHWMKL